MKEVTEIVIVCREDMIPTMMDWVRDFGVKKVSAIVRGGNSRQQSVLKGIEALSENVDYFAIHDGARPWIKSELILSVSELAKEKGAAAPIIPCVDTLKVINPKENSIDKHLERATLGAIQTPQAFDFETLYQANLKAIENNFSSTDDTEIWSKFSGKKVFYCDGDVENKKITYKSDILKVKK